MRCNLCHSYIPEGMTNANECPNCGNKSIQEKPSPTLTSESLQENKQTVFAPYFTIQTKLTYTPRGLGDNPTLGSISFGSEGFSIISCNGKKWEKIYYRNLLSAQRQKNKVLLSSTQDTEKELTLYNPFWPTWFVSGSSKRAELFCELLEVVKKGLTPDQVDYFRRKLN